MTNPHTKEPNTAWCLWCTGELQSDKGVKHKDWCPTQQVEPLSSAELESYGGNGGKVDLLKAKKLAKKLREYEISPAKSLAHWHDGNSKPCYESNCILTGFTSEPKATIQDVVNATPKGQAVVNKALVNAHASMEAVSEQASTLTELIEILNCDDGIIPLTTGEDAAKVVNKLQSLIARKEREARIDELQEACKKGGLDHAYFANKMIDLNRLSELQGKNNEH